MSVESVTIIALLIVGMGLVAVASPSAFIDQLVRFDLPAKLWIVALIRLAIGAALWAVAPESAHPGTFRFLGGLTVCAAVALPVLGPDRIARIVDWWATRPSAVLRVWGLFATGLGSFLLWSLHG